MTDPSFGSVHVRPILEVIDDCRTCDLPRYAGEDEHESCLRMDEAARWPDPAPWHSLGVVGSGSPPGPGRESLPCGPS